MKIRDVPQTGSLGETVSYQNRYGQIRRRKIIPRNPRTRGQMDWRAAFQRARSFWGTLTDEQFLAWATVGGNRRTRSVLGRSNPVSGYLVSVSVNAHLALLGLPMVADPPPIPVFAASPVVGLITSNTGGVVSLKLQLSRKPGQYVLVFGARPQGPGVTYVDHYSLLGVLPDEDAEEVDITDLYVARFGEPPAGKRIFIRTLQQINGWRDRPNTFTARIPAL
ncbi:MAG: hypothetical protein NTX51_20330 [Verrucomicrobia bacterium]|nr:hypothetical protein [Verrucomicrobiota bacterium]